jgi:hypothetical protein
MCVLTYVPIENMGFILTSNRDEKVSRLRAKPPLQINLGKHRLIAPIDAQSGGTWIGTSKDFSLVLLNGGFVKHEVDPLGYKQSRGNIIKQYFEFYDANTFFEEFDFSGMEPFTLVIIPHDYSKKIVEIRWCSGARHFLEKNKNEAHIWSSATLYTDEAIAQRASWFYDYIQEDKHKLDPQAILDFHENGGAADPENSIFLKRSIDLRTISTTQIKFSQVEHTLNYTDFLSNKSNIYRIY